MTRARALVRTAEQAFARPLPPTRLRVLDRRRMRVLMLRAGLPAVAAPHGLGLTQGSTIYVREDTGGRTLLHELVHRFGLTPDRLHPWVVEAVTEEAAAELAEATAQRRPALAPWVQRGRGYARERAWLRRAVLQRVGGTAVDLARQLAADPTPAALLATLLAVADPSLDHAHLIRALAPTGAAVRGRRWAPPRLEA